MTQLGDTACGRGVTLQKKITISDVFDLIDNPLLCNYDCVSSPALFSVYTNDCRSVERFISEDDFFKCADGKALLGLIKEDKHLVHEKEVQSLVSWCDSTCVHLNTKKTKEGIIDFRNIHSIPPPLIIK